VAEVAAAPLVGSPVPRVATPPLRDLTPETSLGFDLIDFARNIGYPLLPWQETAAIRALELLPDGSLRHRVVIIVVGRQSGKTTLMKIWALWALYRRDMKMVLGVAQSLDIAREAWQGAVDIVAERRGQLPVGKVRFANGEQTLTLQNGARYRIAATTRSAGRGLSVDLLIADELAMQRSEAAWAALLPTVTARANGQVIAISSGGDEESVVLNTQRTRALAGGDDAPCLLEWSAEDGCDLDDTAAWCQAIPGIGHTTDERSLRALMGALSPDAIRREYFGQYAETGGGLDAQGWVAGLDAQGSLAGHVGSLTVGIDVSQDGQHVALVAATALPDGKVRVEPLASWESTREARSDLPALLEQIKPVGLAWYPSGPAGALAPLLQSLPYAKPITGGDVTAACMGFADMVRAGAVLHNGHPRLDTQVAGADILPQGDAYRFTRRGGANTDALYAASGAVWLARTKKTRRNPIFVL